MAAVRAATSPCTGITRLMGWKNRDANPPGLQTCQDRNTTGGRHPEKPAAIGRVCPSTSLRDSEASSRSLKTKLRTSEEKQANLCKPPYSPWDILVQRERTSLMHCSGVTNDMPAQYHPPRTKGQRSYFHSKQARTSSHLKREEKRAEGNHSFSKRRSLFYPQFPPYPKCKGHQNSLSGLKGEVRVCVYGGNKSKLQGIARRAVMSSWRGNNRNAHWTGFVQ